MEVLDGLDEVRLAQDHVQVFWFLDGYDDQAARGFSCHWARDGPPRAGPTPTTNFAPLTDPGRKAAVRGAGHGRDPEAPEDAETAPPANLSVFAQVPATTLPADELRPKADLYPVR